MKRVLLLVTSFLLIIAIGASAAQVTVVKQAAFSNPRIIYDGVSGNQEFSGFILSNLKSCGWFDVVSSAPARFNISGKVSGSQLTLNVRGEKNFNVVMNIDSSNVKWSSYKAVDALLNKIFNIPGICASKIVFAAQHGSKKDLMVCDFDGSNLKQVTSNDGLTLGPAWALDNSMIVYTLIKNNFADVVGLNLNAMRNTTLANFSGLNSGGAISPDGKQMALILSKDKNVDLYVKEAYGKGLKRITNINGAVAGCPAWSPDSRKICFVSNMKMNRPTLYIADLSSNKIYPLNTLGGESVSPSWSPDGSKIVYSAKMGKNYTLAVYDVKNNKSSVVNINAAGDWFNPSWAPDSRHVVCYRKYNYVSQLYIVDTFSGSSRQLLKSKMNLTDPNWSQLYK